MSAVVAELDYNLVALGGEAVWETALLVGAERVFKEGVTVDLKVGDGEGRTGILGDLIGHVP